MGKVSSVITTIEDEVTFMADPKVEFVSLVKHGANMTPFKVLKEEKLGGDSMNKVVQSILVRNDLPDDAFTKAMEGMSRKEVQQFDSYTKYEQLPATRLKEDSLIVLKHEEVEGAFLVVGELEDEVNKTGTLEVEVEKEAVDYATLDNLYSELYAMADIVGGAMRQENAGIEFRKSTILSAVDNFRAFAEVVLTNLSNPDAVVKAEDFPTFVFPFIVEKKEEAEVEKAEETVEKTEKTEETVEPKTEEVQTEAEQPVEVVEKEGNEILEAIGSLSTLVQELKGGLDDAKKATGDLAGKLDGVVQDVEKIKNTTLSSKSEAEEVEVEKAEKNIWAGSIFKG